MFVTDQTTIFVYDADGDLAAEYTVNVPAPPSLTTSYLTEDALGSVRVTNSFGEIKARRDFLPFGEELYAGLAGRNTGHKYSSSSDDTRKKFATYQRDVETGLDFAQSRYYSPMHGRFTSPDEFKGGPDELFDFTDIAIDNPTFYAELNSPQSLNKYQYAFNNPCKYVDSDGHCAQRVVGAIAFGVIGGVTGYFVGTTLGAVGGGGGGAALCTLAVPGGGTIACGAAGGGAGAAVGGPIGAGVGFGVGGYTAYRFIPCPETAGPSSTSTTISSGTVTAAASGSMEMAEHRPQKQSKGSRTRTAPKHERAEARRQREQNRPRNPNNKKPKKPPEKRKPGTPRKNKYPPKTGPNAPKPEIDPVN